MLRVGGGFDKAQKMSFSLWWNEATGKIIRIYDDGHFECRKEDQ